MFRPPVAAASATRATLTGRLADEISEEILMRSRSILQVIPGYSVFEVKDEVLSGCDTSVVNASIQDAVGK
jgi:hypothetical protein